LTTGEVIGRVLFVDAVTIEVMFGFFVLRGVELPLGLRLAVDKTVTRRAMLVVAALRAFSLHAKIDEFSHARPRR